jgi:hypothetical protein
MTKGAYFLTRSKLSSMNEMKQNFQMTGVGEKNCNCPNDQSRLKITLQQTNRFKSPYFYTYMIGTKPTGIIIKNGEEYHLLRIMVAH